MLIRIATSAEYQLFVNGHFLAFRPAKCAKGLFKVDEIDLDGYLNEEENTVVFNVLSARINSRINSYSMMDQEPFATAEI